MDKRKQGLVLSLFALLMLILITCGITYAFFSYIGEGTTDNIITTGSITFLYTEVDKIGNGISIENAFPKSDEVGKVSTKTNEYFDFKITGDTTSGIAIPYEVTARKSKTSDNIDEYVRVYLTKGVSEEEVLLDNYQNLTQTSKVDSSKYIEKTIYAGKVPANNSNYEEIFRLRMWLREGTRFENEQMNNKTFTININVYANAKVVTNEEIALENSTKINTLSINDIELTAISGQNYDYETTLPEGTTSTTINIETVNSNAKVNVEKIDNLASDNNVKRLAVTKNLQLTNGENFFKITVISENEKNENEYKIRIYVGQEGISLSDAIKNKYKVIETPAVLTDSNNNTNDEDGLYKSTLTNSENPTYYFRGNVENYIDFAGFTWRVVRINEDGTIRIVMQDGINNNNQYIFNSVKENKDNMYYSNSDTAKVTLESWYSDKIASNTKYSNRVATGEYYCEQAKVSYSSEYGADSGADMIVYNQYIEPNFRCSDDANGYGIVNASVGLLSYDEVLHAGGYRSINENYYLHNGTHFWTMSPCGFSSSLASLWIVYDSGYFSDFNAVTSSRLRAVLNLKADTAVTGTGDNNNHWVVSN